MLPHLSQKITVSAMILKRLDGQSAVDAEVTLARMVEGLLKSAMSPMLVISPVEQWVSI